MTRLVFVRDAAVLGAFALAPGDMLVPLSDSAAFGIACRELGARALALPAAGAIHDAGRAEAFATAQRLIAALAQAPGWEGLLRYQGYDLRTMTLKNAYFELEWLAAIRQRVRLAFERMPGSGGLLLDHHPDVVAAVHSVRPDVSVQASLSMRSRLRGEAWIKPPGHWVQTRWQAARAQPVERPQSRPIVCFLHHPGQAWDMARALALMAQERPVMIAQMNRFAWPIGCGFTPASLFHWRAYMPRGAGWRTLRHVVAARASTDAQAFTAPGQQPLPRHLLWELRFDDIQRYASMIEGLTGLAEGLNPALWITLEDMVAFGKCVAAVGDRMGIPTLTVQSSTIGAHPYRIGLDVVGMYAAYGAGSRAALVARGADPARIVVTGPVRYDDIQTAHTDAARRDWLAAAGLDASRPVILFASQPAQRLLSGAVKRLAVETLVKAAGAVGAQVVLCRYPDESGRALRALLAAVGRQVLVIEDPRGDWLAASDVVATISGDAVYAAALAQRPALVLDWSGNPDVREHLAAGIALCPASPDQAAAVLARLLYDDRIRSRLAGNQRRFVVEHLAGGDGRAAQRLVNLAHERIEKAEGDA